MRRPVADILRDVQTSRAARVEVPADGESLRLLHKRLYAAARRRRYAWRFVRDGGRLWVIK